MSEGIVKAMSDLTSNVSFGGGGGGGGGWTTSTKTGDPRNVSKGEKYACAAIGIAVAAAVDIRIGGTTDLGKVGGKTAGGIAGKATYDACVGSLSTYAGYSDMMIAP